MMSVIDVNELLAEAKILPPCGPDLEKPSSFDSLKKAEQDVLKGKSIALTKLLDASRGTPEIVANGHIYPAKSPDWRQVLDGAANLFETSKNLRLVGLIMRGSVATRPFSEACGSVKLLHDVLGRYWGDLHPRSLMESDDQSTGDWLSEFDECIGISHLVREISSCRFIPASTTHSALTFDEYLSRTAIKADESSSAKAGREMIHKAIVSNPQVKRSLGETIENLELTLNLLQEHAKLSQELLAESGLARLRQFLERVMSVDSEPSNQAGEVTVKGVPRPTVSTEDQPQSQEQYGQIDNVPSDFSQHRRQLVEDLKSICTQIEITQPTNPASLFIRRAIRLLEAKSFVDVIKDVMPSKLPRTAETMEEALDGILGSEIRQRPTDPTFGAATPNNTE
jgi:type VI secretion system protein ImpA